MTLKKRLPVTLGMIVKNEERFLPRCLEAVYRRVAELVIVDTGSGDRTPDIARKYGARLICFKPEADGPVASARNLYLRHATQPWVLSLDADETIAEKDAAKIERMIKRKSADAYRFMIRNYGDEYNLLRGWRPNAGEYPAEERRAKTHGWWTNHIIRLFRNDRGYVYEGVHLMIESSIRRNRGRIFDASFPIHHFECLKGTAILLKKQKNYLRLSLEELKNSPNRAKTHLDIAVCLFCLRKGDAAAISHLRMALRILPGYKDAHKMLGMIYQETGRPAVALRHLGRTLKTHPKDADLHCLSGMALIAMRRYAQAAESLQRSLRHHRRHPVALHALGAAYELLNHRSRAAKYYQKSLRILPTFAPARESLSRLTRRKGRVSNQNKTSRKTFS